VLTHSRLLQVLRGHLDIGVSRGQHELQDVVDFAVFPVAALGYVAWRSFWRPGPADYR
jgi:hypothetical protein